MIANEPENIVVCICSDASTLLVYKSNAIEWNCKLPVTPLAIQIGSFQGYVWSDPPNPGWVKVSRLDSNLLQVIKLYSCSKVLFKISLEEEPPDPSSAIRPDGLAALMTNARRAHQWASLPPSIPNPSNGKHRIYNRLLEYAKENGEGDMDASKVKRAIRRMMRETGLEESEASEASGDEEEDDDAEDEEDLDRMASGMLPGAGGSGEAAGMSLGVGRKRKTPPPPAVATIAGSATITAPSAAAASRAAATGAEKKASDDSLLLCPGAPAGRPGRRGAPSPR